MMRCCANGSKSQWKAISAKTKCNLAASIERVGMRLITITGEGANPGIAAEKLAKYWT